MAERALFSDSAARRAHAVVPLPERADRVGKGAHHNSETARAVPSAFAHPTACFVTLFGITLAYYYLHRGRLWPPIVAHALFDFVALFDFGTPSP